MRLPPAIGIDFGTTKSALAFVEIRATNDSKPSPKTVTLYSDGSQFMPSAVYIPKDGMPLVGRKALAKTQDGDFDPNRLFRNFKLDIGLPEPKEQYHNANVTPVDLAYLVIRELRLLAQATELVDGPPIEEATITVPSGWSDERKAETKKAAMAAGIRRLDLIREPYAALLSIGPDKFISASKSRNLVVVDFGGGTCDVAVCQAKPGTLFLTEPRITEYTKAPCGGALIDSILTQHFVQKASHDLNVSIEELLKKSDWIACQMEEEKIDFVAWLQGLSYGDNLFRVRNLIGDRDYSISMTREDFENLIEPALSCLQDAIRGGLERAEMGPKQVDGVFLVGGSSLLPMAKPVVQTIFAPEKVHVTNQVRSHVANGAAMWEYYRLGNSGAYVNAGLRRYSTLRMIVEKRQLPWSKNPYTTKILVRRGELVRQAKRRSLELRTTRAKQTSVDIYIVEGEAENPYDKRNEPVAKAKLEFSMPLPIGTRIVVEYWLDLQGVLILEARLKEGNDSVIVIGHTTISSEEIDSIRSKFRIGQGGLNG
jgi:molecular chaperone DnaK